MDAVFQLKHTLTGNQVDCRGRCKLSVLLSLAQEAAAGHCRLLQLDWDTLAKHRLFWAVIRTRAQITRLPGLGETITVQTWPMPTTRTAYPRAVSFSDREGNELARIISLWVLMDTDTRAMVLPGKSGIAVTGQLLGSELAAPGSLVPGAGENSLLRRVHSTDLDQNGHVNNARYLDWVEALLPGPFHQDHPVREFTVCYLSEARENQEIRLDYSLSDASSLQVDGYDAKTDDSGRKTRIFSAQLLF